MAAEPDQQQGQRQMGAHQLYERVRDRPCQVLLVDKQYQDRDEPLRTREAIIDRELQRVYDANTLQEIHAALETAVANLQQLEVFNAVDVVIDEPPQDDPAGCSVLINLQEKKWYKAHAGTYVQGTEGSLECGVELRNLTGHADQWHLSGEWGNRNSSTFTLGFRQPRAAGLPLIPEARIFQHRRNQQQYSSFTEAMRGISLGASTTDGRHALMYELGWRQLSDPDLQASKAVRAQMNDYLKSALRYTFSMDRRDDAVLPSTGWALKSSSEVAGLGPDAKLRYCRQQLDAQCVWSLLPRVALSITATTGLLLPWALPTAGKPLGSGAAGVLQRNTCISERFFLGGPDSLRGFEHRGAGPSDARRMASNSDSSSGAPSTLRDAIGGDLYTSFLAAITVALPHQALDALRIHAHAFVNGGNSVLLGGATRGSDDGVAAGGGVRQLVSARMREMGNTFRWSAGFGLVLPSWFGRFEANYVWVLSHQEHDRVKRGLQLGFATSVLL